MKTSVLLVVVCVLAGSALGADSLNVRLVGTCTTPYSVMEVVTRGEYAYAPDWSPGFHVISIADPANPTAVAYCSIPPYAIRVAVSGDYAYVSAMDDGLRVISLADPANPYEVGSCSIPSYARGVNVIGEYAYVLSDASRGGLLVISVAEPTLPIEVGRCSLAGGGSWDLDVKGDHAYVACQDSGLIVISVADPANPDSVGHCPTPGRAVGVAVSGEYAYVAADFYGLRVISVADPAKPVEVGYRDTPGRACGVAVIGDYAYVADGPGMRAISVSDPANPVEVGYYTHATTSFAFGAAVDSNYIYIAHQTDGLEVYEYYGAGVEEAPRAEVRTTNAATIVRGVLFLSPASGVERGASSVLLDISGGRVMDLNAGSNDVRALAPGVYFIKRQEAGDGRPDAAVRKVVVTR